MPVLLGVWHETFEAYGVPKLWKEMLRAGHNIGRDQCARLMRQPRIGVVQKGGKQPKTTKSDPEAVRADELVERRFVADRPHVLWVTDITYVATWSGWRMCVSSPTCSVA